jgi:hypothetical protein
MGLHHVSRSLPNSLQNLEMDKRRIDGEATLSAYKGHEADKGYESNSVAFGEVGDTAKNSGQSRGRLGGFLERVSAIDTELHSDPDMETDIPEQTCIFIAILIT